jgi:ketosteroid isomerase-like protein
MKITKQSIPFVMLSLLIIVLNRNIAIGESNSPTSVNETVAALDKKYQMAVKQNDVDSMSRILADDFVLVTGVGKIVRKDDLLDEARSKRVQYEVQDDTDQTVRTWGDTAVVTAKLHEKGIDAGKPFDYTLWFSDTYVRTPTGWRYVFGQASLPLPEHAKPQS